MRIARSVFTSLLFLQIGAGFSCNSPNSSAEPTPPIQPANPPTAAQDFEFEPDPREITVAKTVAKLLEGQHVRGTKIDDQLSVASFGRFLEILDPDKLFLLQEDVDTLKAFEKLFDDQLLAGRLMIGHLGNSLLVKRVAAIETQVTKQLESPFDFSVDETRQTDAEKLPYAKSMDELNDRWRRALKLQALARLITMEERHESLGKAIAEAEKETPAADELEDHAKKLKTLKNALSKIPATREERIDKVRADLSKSYSARFARLKDPEVLGEASSFINAVATSFDPHTVYMPPVEKENFDIAMSGSLEGIGAVLVEEDHFVAVREIVVGSASWRQGELEAGDIILAVAQDGEDPVDIYDMRINKVVTMIRGKKGTTVQLTVEKADGSTKVIPIVRDKVEIEESFAQGAVIEGKSGHKMGYIYLPSFYGASDERGRLIRHSAGDVGKLLGHFKKRNIKGVILDLRSNGGGFLEDARTMTGFFIEQGPVVQTKMPDGTIEILADEDPSIRFDGELVVIVDRFSASASEIVAGALQDYGRAVIVGPGPTHGKGTVQGLLDLDKFPGMPRDKSMGVLKLTIQEFYRINGASTQWKGVEPDIHLPDAYKHVETGERNLDNSLPWSQVEAIPFQPWPASKWDKQVLNTKSLERQAQNSFFQTLEKRSLILKERRDDSLIPLKREAYEARIEKQREEMKALETDDEAKTSITKVSLIQYAQVANGSKDPRALKHEKKKQEAWKKGLMNDFVLEEASFVLADMMSPQ